MTKIFAMLLCWGQPENCMVFKSPAGVVVTYETMKACKDFETQLNQSHAEGKSQLTAHCVSKSVPVWERED